MTHLSLSLSDKQTENSKEMPDSQNSAEENTASEHESGKVEKSKRLFPAENECERPSRRKVKKRQELRREERRR